MSEGPGMSVCPNPSSSSSNLQMVQGSEAGRSDHSDEPRTGGGAVGGPLSVLLFHPGAPPVRSPGTPSAGGMLLQGGTEVEVPADVRLLLGNNSESFFF